MKMRVNNLINSGPIPEHITSHPSCLSTCPDPVFFLTIGTLLATTAVVAAAVTGDSAQPFAKSPLPVERHLTEGTEMSSKPSLCGSSLIVYKTCLEMSGRKQVLLVPVLQFPGLFMRFHARVCDVSTRKPTESADPACC
jgi:hypothetical protein